MIKITKLSFASNPTTVVIDMNDGAEIVEAAPIVAPVAQPAAEVVSTPEVVEKDEKTPIEPTPSPVKVSTPTARAARSTVGARAPRKSGKTTKLGIKKAPVNFNFEAAEAQAKQDLERNVKYGVDEEEAVKPTDDHVDEKSAPKAVSSRLAYSDNNTSGSTKDKEDDYEKLGFGMSRMNMNEKTSSISMPSQKSYQQNQQSDSTSARDKFGSARAISSDQYFGRNDYDPAVAAAESSRLSQFSSAKAISSDQYFGRESENYDNQGSYGNNSRSYNSSNNPDVVSLGEWDNVQDQAVAMARKFVDQAALDLDAVKDLAENASSRVRNYFNA